ncbi:MAG: TonB-dependent receptor [Gemmatimonadetes bacterium]|nr:TonB-dependent receptor [Gemmatimonadota bacterium]
MAVRAAVPPAPQPAADSAGCRGGGYARAGGVGARPGDAGRADSTLAPVGRSVRCDLSPDAPAGSFGPLGRRPDDGTLVGADSERAADPGRHRPGRLGADGPALEAPRPARSAQVQAGRRSGYLQPVTGVSPTYQFQNIGAIRNKGVELEAGLRFGRVGLDGLLYTTSSRVEQIGQRYAGPLWKGDQLPEIPKASGSARLT